MKRWRRFGPIILLLVTLALAGCQKQVKQKTYPLRPALVVVVMIDQFRADYLARFDERFLPANGPEGVGGFNYLREYGALFPQARVNVLQAMTGPGHAIIATGAYPARNGVPLNKWYDAERGRKVYCVDGDRVPFSRRGDPDAYGHSPANILSTTLGDEMKNAGLKSRVVAISHKDRAAVAMAGHRGDAALFFDTSSFVWTSNDQYFPDGQLPAWVEALNQAIAARRGKPVRWPEAAGASGRTEGSLDESFALRDVKIGEPESLWTPFGVDTIFDAAEAALTHMKLGRGPGTDLLWLSVSPHDKLGHAVGPNRREIEELTVAEDRALARLLRLLNEHVPGGLGNVIVALSADHGVAPMPDYLQRHGVISDVLDDDDLTRRLEEHLRNMFGQPPGGTDWVAYEKSFNFYFDRAALATTGQSLEAVTEAAKDFLRREPQFDYVISSFDVAARRLPGGRYEKAILNTYFPGRSGDVIAISRPFVMTDSYPTTHMTNYNYDTVVPLAFAGPVFKPGLYATPAETIDLAPTLAFLLGIVPPAAAEGRILHEILLPLE